MNIQALYANLDRYSAGGAILRHAVSGLSPEQLTARPGPGAWSSIYLIAHLVDTDLLYSERIKRVIAESNPTLLVADENLWIAGLHPASMDVEEGVALFDANRRWTARLLRACAPETFTRAGMHSVSGRKTLVDLVVGVANHLDNHLKFLYAKRANLGVSVYPRYTREPEE